MGELEELEILKNWRIGRIERIKGNERIERIAMPIDGISVLFGVSQLLSLLAHQPGVGHPS